MNDRTKRLVTTLLSAALVVGSVTGGAVYTGYVVNGADRAVKTEVWRKPAKDQYKSDTTPELFRGLGGEGLRQKLLPAPDGWVLGPDEGEFGNDTVLGKREAVALLKDESKGMDTRERREYREYVDDMGVQGVALRTYADSEDFDQVVGIQIIQVEDQKSIREVVRLRRALFDALGVLRDGPKIKGHPQARCFQAPENSKSELDGMMCDAHDGEFMITLTANGPKPLDLKASADLLRRQLNHLRSPGEFV
ncbi:hypothetical protein [Streptomyces alkaliterrae]|uniref:Secreted protein n=1 Tax=Streptomyces alkaliterrae TaxID=2213162 RepID=A0A5P0YSS7_9ACTN|nr:hypothetical protein [Streptomyces alkaliterrae]MBB1257593.1 hypothetical protein [Streptomyces alkaliterrae]MQS03373.1 hypothetical protein [Streptomyces alkaliterrae]